VEHTLFWYVSFTMALWRINAELQFANPHFGLQFCASDACWFTVGKRHCVHIQLFSVCRALIYYRCLQTFLSEGHICYYATVRGPDILHNVIVSGYVTFYKVKKNFVIMLSFHCYCSIMSPRARWNGFAGRIWPADCSLETLDLIDRKVCLLT